MKVLIFAPHSAIWIHAFPEALVGEALKQEGIEIVYIGCGGLFADYCVAMSAYGLDYVAPKAQKGAVCHRCKKQRDIIRTELGLTGYDITDVISAEDVERIEQILASVNNSNFMDLVVDGIPVGKVSLYQFLLNKKKNNLEFSQNEWSEYLIELRNSLRSLVAGTKILKTERPERLLVYNSLYSVNRVWCLLAESLGIPHFFMHAGGNLGHRLQTLMIGQAHALSFLKYNVECWRQLKDLACTEHHLTKVTDHFVELLKGQSVFAYSAAKERSKVDIRGFFNVDRNQKMLVATLSSYDERFAAETVGAIPPVTDGLFRDQVEWVKSLVEFVRGRAELALIIRVHPREFPNKREQVKSDHARRLEAVFVDLPKNVQINWPRQGISLYDLAGEADVFLNAWSSVGKEMALVGLPVVIYCPDLVYYPPELNYVGTTADSYFTAIESALSHGWNANRIFAAYRWHVAEFSRATFDISDSYQKLEHRPVALWYRLARAVWRKVFPYSEQRKDCRSRSQQLKEKTRIAELVAAPKVSPIDVEAPASETLLSLDEEKRVIRREVARLMKALYPGGPSTTKLGRHLNDFVNRHA